MSNFKYLVAYLLLSTTLIVTKLIEFSKLSKIVFLWIQTIFLGHPSPFIYLLPAKVMVKIDMHAGRFSISISGENSMFADFFIY